MVTGSRCPPGRKPFDRPLLIQTGTNPSSRPDYHPDSNTRICIGDTLLKVWNEPIAKDPQRSMKASSSSPREPPKLPMAAIDQGSTANATDTASFGIHRK